jgi:hypothetical protein
MRQLPLGPTPLVEDIEALVRQVAQANIAFVCHEATARGRDDVMCRGWRDTPALRPGRNRGRIVRLLVVLRLASLPTWKPDDDPIVDEVYAGRVREAAREARTRRRSS